MAFAFLIKRFSILIETSAFYNILFKNPISFKTDNKLEEPANNILTMFKKIDLFGQPVLFKFKGNEKSRSSIGGLFSILLLGFVLWAVYAVGKDIFYKKNPKIIASESFNEDPKPVVLSDETFNFAVGIQMPVTYAHYINESIYTIEAHLTRQTRDFDQDGKLHINAEYISLSLERCTKEHFGVHAPKFENLELNEMYCLKRQQPNLEKIILQGTFESPIFQDLEIIAKPCNSETSNVTCASQKKIDEMLGSCYFAIYYTNLAINAKNATDPTFVYRDSYYTTVSNTFFKDIPFWLSHVELKSDFGWLLASEETEDFIRVGYVGERAAYLEKNLKRMINLRIRMDKITARYERSYLKLGDIFASANGFGTIGLIIVYLFLGPFSKLKFYERLINELFELKIMQKDFLGRSNKKHFTKGLSNSKTVKAKEDGEMDPKAEQDQTNLKLNNNKSRIINQDDCESFSKVDDEKENEKSVMSLNHQGTSQFKKEILERPSQPFFDVIDIKSAQESIAETNQGYFKTGEFLKTNIKNTAEERSAQIPVKYLSDSSVISISSTPHIKYSDPPFLHQKPEIPSPRPKLKFLETYEPYCPPESFAVLESLILEKRQTLQGKTRQFSPGLMGIERLKPKKANFKSLDLANKEIREEEKHITEESDERTYEEELDKKAQDLSSRLTKDSDKLSISFREYLISFFWKSKALKAKFKLLEEGIRRIEERIDIFNVLKKFREVDKLKLLLLENEQLVLFDTLPKPELSFKTAFGGFQRSTSFKKLKDTKFVSEKRKKDLILIAYKNLKKKMEKTMIDRKLLEIYDDLITS